MYVHAMNARQLRYVFAILAWVVPFAGSCQTPEDRLLPESFTRSIGFEWKQDGRVIDITLTSPKNKWVVTEATLVVHYPRRSAEAASAPALSARRKTGKENHASLDELITQVDLYFNKPSTHKIKLQLHPGSTTAAHLELEDSKPASEVRLDEARGREPTLMERLKYMVQ